MLRNEIQSKTGLTRKAIEYYEERGLINPPKTEDYSQSPMKQIYDKLKKHMQDNNYYETAIPLIRKFSKPYDDYYTKLIVANDKYIEYYRREIK